MRMKERERDGLNLESFFILIKVKNKRNRF